MLKTIFFKVFLFLLIFSELYLGDTNLFFNYSPRVIFLLISSIIIIISKKVPTSKTIYFSILTYLFFYFSSVVLNNSELLPFIFDVLISRFLFALIIAKVISILVPKNISFETFINYILLILLLNSFVILGQFFEIFEVWAFTIFLTQSRFLEISNYNLQGLTGTVSSGYLFVILIPLILYKLKQSKKQFLYFPLLLISLWSAFVLDQRSAFILILINILFFILFILKNQNLFYKIFTIITSFLLIIIYYNSLDSFFLDDSFQSIINTDDTLRSDIFVQSLTFILENPFWGGFDAFKNTIGTSPHNLFLNAWIRAGFIGFLSISILFFITIYKAFKIIKNSIGRKDLKYTFSIIMINLLMMSMTHNSGIVSGEIFTFIFMFILFEKMNKNYDFISSNIKHKSL